MSTDIILWQQASSLSKGSVLSHNGKFLTSCDADYEKVIDQIIIADFSFCTPLFHSDLLHIYQDSQQVIYILSNFEEEDESGRKIAFAAKIFASRKKDVIEVLMKEITLHNRHLPKYRLIIITVILFLKDIIITIGLFLLIVLILTILQ